MLNYIWTGLIVASLGFALFYDLGDMASDRYRNGQPLTVEISSRPVDLRDRKEDRIQVMLHVDAETYIEHFGLSEKLARERTEAEITWDEDNPSRERPDPFPPPPIEGEHERAIRAAFAAPIPGVLEDGEDGLEFVAGELDMPAPMDRIVAATEGVLRFGIIGLPDDIGRRDAFAALSAEAHLTEVRFYKVQEITQAAFSMAKTAVMGIALPLIGILALWLGIVKIAEAGGLVNVLVKIIQPVLHPLFPEIPKGHPAIGMIALNLAANVLGLGNAATPMGIKAMEEMQKLNPDKDTATNGMCTFLAINTASVQLLPPATLVAVMGIATGQLWLPILAVTGLSLIIGIVAARSLEKLPVFVRSNPMRNGPAPGSSPPQPVGAEPQPTGTHPASGEASTDAEKGGDA
ncbi:MAG: nucleoside recognition domain-containing protein [Planctomycetota bacterium]